MANNQQLLSLLETAFALVDEALFTHIYNAEDGDKPPADCPYSQFLAKAGEVLAAECDERRNTVKARLYQANMEKDLADKRALAACATAESWRKEVEIGLSEFDVLSAKAEQYRKAGQS